MQFEVKSRIIDEQSLKRALVRITHEILEKNKGTDDLCLIGIRSRGVPLAEIIAENIREIEGADVPVGSLDITLYRDDLTELNTQPLVGESHIPFSVTGKKVVLVDDVLYTGRTVRAAIEALFRLGRPSAVRLAVVVDRGHRELPIRADYVGKNIPTSLSEVISVKVPPFDDEYGVDLCDIRQ